MRQGMEEKGRENEQARMNATKQSTSLSLSSYSGLIGGETALGGRESPLPWDNPEALTQF